MSAQNKDGLKNVRCLHVRTIKFSNSADSCQNSLTGQLSTRAHIFQSERQTRNPPRMAMARLITVPFIWEPRQSAVIPAASSV